MPSMPRSVTFKCTFNDGDQYPLVGFADTCTLDNIAHNVRNGRAWCSDKKCGCRKFHDAGMKGAKPEWPCMESKLFKEWKFGAGSFLGSEKEGRIPLKHTALGKFAIFTTRFPEDKHEADRRIVGLFRIEKIKENSVAAAERGRIRLPLEEAKELFFWAYASNQRQQPDWRTGLFRYLDDGQVHRILDDVATTVRDDKTKSEIDYLIKTSFGDKPAPPPAGCLPLKSTQRAETLTRLRKYGPGGEGKAHKELKEWIAKHPEVLHLSDVIETKPEYRYRSGDAADIVFRHKSGNYTVVEIETDTPLPGAHQMIKYCALLCAEKGWTLDSKEVQAILVAWSIPADVREFCEKYGVGFSEQHMHAKPKGMSA